VRSIDGRISKLENRFGIAKYKPRYLIVLDGARSPRALSNDTCIEILDEAGFLHTAGFGVLSLIDIPDGLTAHETEIFLRENGAKICGPRRAQNSGGAGVEGDGPRSAYSIEIKLEDD
jgi:hypothetical protein